MSSVALGVLAFVTAQRLIELWIAGRNTRRLLAQGAVEHGRGHYWLIVALHSAWLLALWLLAPGQPVSIPLLALFAILQLGRIWVLVTLGQRWTTRILVLPGVPRIRRGPYRLTSHPNYLIVVLEIAILPLAFGLIVTALIFSLINALLLSIRIRVEGRALASAEAGR